jgi:hypothetical protein
MWMFLGSACWRKKSITMYIVYDTSNEEMWINKSFKNTIIKRLLLVRSNAVLLGEVSQLSLRVGVFIFFITLNFGKILISPVVIIK